MEININMAKLNICGYVNIIKHDIINVCFTLLLSYNNFILV